MEDETLSLAERFWRLEKMLDEFEKGPRMSVSIDAVWMLDGVIDQFNSNRRQPLPGVPPRPAKDETTEASGAAE
jgi:hypothetical protein